MKAPLAALLTDFGHEDHFVGVMKGVILSRAPGARLVDLCHGVAPQDVRGAALRLRASVRYFPEGTLFVCVVDPGVGSPRPILWARTQEHQFLAPDNGLLSWVGPFRRLRRVENRGLFLKPVSRTFHGRDVFAPAAAALLAGLKPSELGPEAAGMVSWPYPAPRRVAGRWRGEVLTVDRFGNAVTNLEPRHVGARRVLEACGRRFPLRTHYACVAEGRPVAVVGSSGSIELSLRGGNLSGGSRVRAGEAVHVR
ncbi:MAG: SAM-dependent chlorinase/fluorinase [Elusimicrobia bacterium]|nr:SAM-dependent chlorinase/fluorinase [Elusimicrobiota bacterium]